MIAIIPIMHKYGYAAMGIFQLSWVSNAVSSPVKD